MKPIVWRRINEYTRIISPGSHGRANNVSHIEFCNDVPICLINFPDFRFDVGVSIWFNKYPRFTGIDIMMESYDVLIPVICDERDGPIIKFYAKEVGPLCHVYRVIEKSRSRNKSACRAQCAYPSQFSVC